MHDIIHLHRGFIYYYYFYRLKGLNKMGFIIIIHYCWFVLSGNNFSQNFNFSLIFSISFLFFPCGKK